MRPDTAFFALLIYGYFNLQLPFVCFNYYSSSHLLISQLIKILTIRKGIFLSRKSEQSSQEIATPRFGVSNVRKKRKKGSRIKVMTVQIAA